MIDAEQFKDALQQCLEGTADSATRKSVVHMARSSPELRRILAQSYAFDAMLKGLHHKAEPFVETALDTITHPKKQEELANIFSHTIRRRKAWGRRLLWVPVLAAAASLLVALGMGLWQSELRGPTLAGKIAGIQGEAEAWVLRGKDRIPARLQTPLFVGDVILLGETGGIRIETENGGVQTRLQDASRLEISKPDRYTLTHGRAHVSFSPNPATARHLRFASPWAETDVVGTEFVLIAKTSGTRLRVLKGQVRFRDVRHAESVPVAAGECAMAHQDRDTLFKAMYEPGLTVDGDLVFFDNFAEGIDRWIPALIQNNSDIHPYPESLPPFATWEQVERDGATIGCMVVSSVSQPGDGIPSMLPRDFELGGKFALETDMYLLSGADISIIAGSGNTMEVLYENPQSLNIMNRLTRSRRWVKARVVFQDDPSAADIAPRTVILSYSLDNTLIRQQRITGRIRVLPALQVFQGSMRIDNVTVRERLTFD